MGFIAVGLPKWALVVAIAANAFAKSCGRIIS